MTAPAIARELEAVIERFGPAVQPDSRPGYQGWIVEPGRLIEFATALRDQAGYGHLTSVTGVDYLPDERMEVVYHALRMSGGPPLTFKVQVPRDSAVVPSLVPVYPGADFQEREAWDLLGIRFEGHPNLRRILMWEGFHGHPLRKDWKEAYFEEEAKPYKNRWPEGKVYRIEDKVPHGHNVSFPPDFSVEGWTPEGDEALYAGMRSVEGGNGHGLETDRIIVNMGPQHPSTHGVFRMVVALEGETVVDLQPVMGYLHRNHEKIGERNTFLMNMPFTDRLDYFSSMSNNFGYALAVEKLMDIKPPERAEYIRVIMAELTRIANHLAAVGFLLNDLGAYFTPVLYALEERELILDVFEAVSGSRMMCNYLRFGGVVRDVPPYVMQKIKDLVFDRLPGKTDEMDRLLSENEVLVSRLKGVPVIDGETAVKYSVTGPVLRAAGVPYDIRRADPYSIYDRFDFDVAVRQNGDLFDNYIIRLDEIRQSLRILQQAVKQIPDGPINSQKPQYQVRVPAGEAYGRIESPKGELAFYVVSNGKPNPWRYHVRPASFVNITCLEQMCIGTKIADFVALLGVLDIVMGELDR